MNRLTMIRCPVLLMGRNSVMPSTMPRMAALTKSMTTFFLREEWKTIEPLHAKIYDSNLENDLEAHGTERMFVVVGVVVVETVVVIQRGDVGMR